MLTLRMRKQSIDVVLELVSSNLVHNLTPILTDEALYVPNERRHNGITCNLIESIFATNRRREVLTDSVSKLNRFKCATKPAPMHDK